MLLVVALVLSIRQLSAQYFGWKRFSAMGRSYSNTDVCMYDLQARYVGADHWPEHYTPSSPELTYRRPPNGVYSPNWIILKSKKGGVNYVLVVDRSGEVSIKPVIPLRFQIEEFIVKMAWHFYLPRPDFIVRNW